MADSKVFMVPEGISGGQSQVDPNLLLSMMNGNNGFGGNGNWLWVLFLFFLYGWNRNGMFGNGGEVGGSTERELLMQAINGNANSLGSLANTLNCDINSVRDAINAVQSSIQSVGNQVGMSAQQVINSVQSGNASLASQLAQCCCDNKMAICQQTNTLTSSISNLTNSMTQGFAATSYETAQQTNQLQNSLQNQTQTIIDKLSSMEANAQQDKINSLTAQLTAANSRAERAAELAPIYQQLNAIHAAQPATATVTYPNLIGVPINQALGQVQYNYGFWG